MTDQNVGACAFCGEFGELRNSHVLPAFAYRWLRRRSGTGHIRHTDNPNRRVQDGLKLPWLCARCEEHFSRYETAFATKLFYPWHDGISTVSYDEWLLKFCTSVSWRVLRYARGRNTDAKYTDDQNRLMTEAEARWRTFLNGDAVHPGDFEQHLLIFDLIESTTIRDLPSNINRFMTGGITLDIVGSNRSLMTYAKLGRFNIFGIIQKGPNKWVGTKVHVRHGVIKPDRFEIPGGLMYLFYEKAKLAADGLGAMSSTQRDKVQKDVNNNLDRFAASDQFISIMADYEMFGRDAVVTKD
jgi:hypothetical protein